MVPGMGKLLLDSVFHRDYATVQAVVVVTTVSVLLLNLALDVIYGWLDPRIRFA
jgi:ABC-type dipeptide/oligopeptide/nickel transport system permease component